MEPRTRPLLLPRSCSHQDASLWNVQQVPAVVAALWVALNKTPHGLTTVGIFRLAADQKVAATVEKQLQKGCLADKHPPEVLAHLIKSFVRRLPGGLLGRRGADAGGSRGLRVLRCRAHARAADRGVWLYLLPLLPGRGLLAPGEAGLSALRRVAAGVREGGKRIGHIR